MIEKRVISFSSASMSINCSTELTWLLLNGLWILTWSLPKAKSITAAIKPQVMSILTLPASRDPFDLFANYRAFSMRYRIFDKISAETPQIFSRTFVEMSREQSLTKFALFACIAFGKYCIDYSQQNLLLIFIDYRYNFYRLLSIYRLPTPGKKWYEYW